MAALDLPTDLSLLTLSHPLLHPSSPSSNKRTSDSSDQTPIHPTPALLAADLQHYQDLFSKLRFSYVEQVTKERFLRAITSDPPEFVRPEDNAVLEAVLAREKAALKERKTEVKEVMDSIEEQGRSLAQRYETLHLQKTQLTALPLEIANLQSTITRLRSQQETPLANPLLNQPLAPTRQMLSDRERQLENMEDEIAQLRMQIPAQEGEMESLREELGPLQMRKEKAIREAREARRRRDEGGDGDELEERGRWLRGVEAGLRGMLEV